MPNNLISVVIPAFNEEKNIFACLDSLVAQKTAYIFEVIVVDNNSTDKTKEIAESFKGRLNLKIVPEKIQSRGAARGCGFAQARGEYILSTDADSVVPPDWVDKMTSALEQSTSKIITGGVKIMDLSPSSIKFFNWLWPKYNRCCRIFTGNYFLSGFNFGVQKDLYVRSGGFNPALLGMEDVDLGFRLIKFGKIVFVPNVDVTFSGRRFKGQLFGGFLEYVIEFTRYCLSGKKRGELRDIR